MVACAVSGCTTRSDRSLKSTGITFHSFPCNPDRKALWVNALKRKDWKPSKHSKICSQHFREEDIDRTSVSTVRIRENAVPSIFPPFPPHLRKKKKKRAPTARRKKADKSKEPALPPTTDTPGRKCFVCSKEAGLTGSPLTEVTNITKTKLHQKLSKVIKAELDVIVNEDGVICNGCCRLLNYLDRIEVEHRLLTKSVVDCMRWTSGLGTVRDESCMPEAVLATIEDHSKNSTIPLEKCDLSLDVPAQDTTDESVSRSKTVTTSDVDTKKKNQKLPVGRVTEKKNHQTVLVERVPEKKKNQTVLVERVPEKKKSRMLCRITVKKTDSEQDKQNYHCKVCNFESKHKSVFLFHLERHRQSGYRCDFCDVLLPKDLTYWIARMQKQPECRNS